MHDDIQKMVTAGDRKHIPDLHPCHIREAFDGLHEELRQKLGDRVTFVLEAQGGLPKIYADPVLIESMLAHLATETGEGMTEGAQLTISAEAVELDEAEAAKHPKRRAGRFIRVTLSGGKSKGVEKNCEAAMKAAQAIAKQHHGWIETKSEPGSWINFRAHLPALDGERGAGQAHSANMTASPHLDPSETILVVEDEPDLRDLVTQLLEARGYKTVAAATGAEALAQWERHKDAIHLVLTDLMMPDGMTGHHLAERLLAEAPELPIIFTSGYSRGSDRVKVASIDPDCFLGKPYRPAQLFDIIQRSLQRRQVAVMAAV